MFASYDPLRLCYRELTAAAIHMEWLENSLLVRGNCKQKPLEYYTENACNILFYMKVFQLNVKMIASNIDLRSTESIELFLKSLSFSEDFQDTFEQFMLFSSFLQNSK